MGRRGLAALVAVLGAAGFVAPVRKSISDTRFVLSDLSEFDASTRDLRFRCLRTALQELPDRATFVAPATELPAAEWYQRAIELGFGNVRFVADRADAQQVLEVVPVAPGTGTCGDVDVRIRSRG